MATKEQICSAALILLGAEPIASLAETTVQARQCANIYPIARADILRRHAWNCCIRSVMLPPLAQAPVFPSWGRQFALPGDLLRVLTVGIDGDIPYLLEGNRIFANVVSLPLRYVADVQESEWDSNLVALMVKRMEMDLAYPVTKSASLRSDLKEDFYRQGTGVLAVAKTVDGQENEPEDMEQSVFLSARFR